MKTVQKRENCRPISHMSIEVKIPQILTGKIEQHSFSNEKLYNMTTWYLLQEYKSDSIFNQCDPLY